MNLQRLLSYTRRAVDDFNMIKDGDRIAVGISGGKDSLSLLYALNELSRFYPNKFTVCGITVALGFPGMDFSPVKSFCNDMGIEYRVVETDIAEIIFEARKEKNPCSLCSKMRKGALHDEASRIGCNTIALGHNRDDVIETFAMSLIYEGRINTFSPVSFLDRKALYNIRPIIYVPEKEIRGFVKKNNLPIVKSTCPADGNTKRQEIKELFVEFNKKYDNIDSKIFGAINRRLWMHDKE